MAIDDFWTDEEDEEEVCDECGEPLDEGSYDYLCGGCADKAEAEGRWG